MIATWSQSSKKFRYVYLDSRFAVKKITVVWLTTVKQFVKQFYAFTCGCGKRLLLSVAKYENIFVKFSSVFETVARFVRYEPSFTLSNTKSSKYVAVAILSQVYNLSDFLVIKTRDLSKNCIYKSFLFGVSVGCVVVRKPYIFIVSTNLCLVSQPHKSLYKFSKFSTVLFLTVIFSVAVAVSTVFVVVFVFPIFFHQLS